MKAALPYILIGLYCTNIGLAWRIAGGKDASEHMLSFLTILPDCLKRIIPSFHPQDLLTGTVCGIALRMAVILKSQDSKKFRKGEEYGSARWGSSRQLNGKYADKAPANNTLLTRHVAMSLNGRQHGRNLLQIIVGGSGAGKTRYFCKPNIMQVNGSFLVTDPNGKEVLGYILQAVH